MLKQWVQSFIVLVLLGVSLSSHAEGTARPQKPLYLSYEQRLVITYLMAGAGESETKQLEVAARLQSAMSQYLRAPKQQLEVSNFKEFLQAYQGSWPNSYSVESDLKLLENQGLRGPVVFRAVDKKTGEPSEALQSQIEGFIARQTKDLKEGSLNYLTSNKLAAALGVADGIIKTYKAVGASGFTDKKAWILQGFAKTTDLLHYQMGVIKATGEAIAASGKMNSTSGATTLFMETVFKEYFGRLNLTSKKQIISQFLGDDLNLDATKRFEIMVMNGGPQFQKLLQVIARDPSISPELLKTFKKLESKAKPIPAPIAKALFEAERERYQWISYNVQPLGVGTMAQVHKGKVNTAHGPEDVVIRFLKPEIEARVQEDHRILSEIATLMDQDPRFKDAGFPQLGPVVNDLNKTVADELDLEATKDRQRTGKKVYTREIPFRGQGYKTEINLIVPGIIDGNGGPGSQLMVQELVVGTKLDSEVEIYQENIPDLKRVLVEEIAKVWLDEVLFKSGFFHSDLHQGNFLVEVTDPAINLAILDFGMGGTITHQMQTDIILWQAGMELNRADVIAESIWALSEKSQNTIHINDFKKAVSERISQITSGKLNWQGVGDWTSWAMDAGIRFPYVFVSLNRGLALIDQSLKESGSTETSSNLGRTLALRSARSTLFSLRSKGLLSWADLFKLGWVSATPAPTSAAKLNPLSSRAQCSRIYSKAHTGSLFEGPALTIFDGLISF